MTLESPLMGLNTLPTPMTASDNFGRIGSAERATAQGVATTSSSRCTQALHIINAYWQ